MKRKLLPLIALITVLCLLLSGCNLMGLLSDWLLYRYIHFDNLEYTRPDITALETAAAACVDAAPTEEDLDTLLGLIVDFTNQSSHFATQYMLAYIHYCIDMTDIYWEKEYHYCAGYTARADAARDDVMYALADSPLRDELEAEEYFGEGYFDDYDGDSLWTDAFTALMEQEAGLITRYYEISAQAAALTPGSEEYYTAAGAELESLYAELVALRLQIAGEAGYASYPEFAYEFYYHRDFTPDQADSYIDDIRRELVPLYTHRAETRGFSIQVDGSTEAQTYAYVEQAAKNMGGVIADAFDAMTGYGLYHIAPSENKYDGSFETFLYDYGEPFVFVNPSQTQQDHLTFTHEFGHFCNDYASYGTMAGIDTAEVFSQALEYLSLEYTDCPDSLKNLKLMDSLSIYVEQSAYAAFESRVYALKPEEVTPENIRAAFRETGEAYGFDSWDFDERIYVMISHFYIQPLYVISYVVSNDAAMQLYQMELAKEGSGLQVYMDSLDTEQEGFLGYLEETGLQSPFQPGRAAQVRKTLEEIL